jgi:hypothetical protein
VNTESIVQELEAATDRLNQAIAALQGSSKSRDLDKKVGRVTNGRKRRLSVAARKRMSEGMKQRWAARKKAGKKAL